MKKNILHIIDNLGRGGAETMLVTVLKQLDSYNNIVVTLHPENDFRDELECDKMYCLNLRSNLLTPLAALQLRRIVKENNVSIVHSHLFWSTVVARMGTPKNVSLVTTIHAFVASSIEYKPWRMRIIERLTYEIRKSTIVAVAKGALEEYFRFINVKPHNACHLHTFVNTQVFNDSAASTKEKSEIFRVVTVGNLKEQKDHRFLLEMFKELKNENITLDIYGKGLLQNELQQKIDTHQLKVTLRGQVPNIGLQLGRYDLFVMSSLYEGFSVGVLEAMAMGMPMLLTGIPSFREQCEDTAAYYNLHDRKDFICKLLALKNNPQQLKFLSLACKKRVLENYTLQKHMNGLNAIYRDVLSELKPSAVRRFRPSVSPY